MKSYIFLSIFCSSILFLQCKEEYKETVSSADQLLEKGILGSGGLKKWKNLDTISFYKTSKLYFEDGSLQDSTYQLHTYYMHPEMNGKYSWKESDDFIQEEFKIVKRMKYKNEKVQNLSGQDHEKLRKGFLGAQFVMCLPFKLADSGVSLSVDGKSLMNEKTVSVLKASYNTQNINHTESHDWWHYINSETGALEGYKVHHPPTYAMVSNVSATQIKGVTFPTYRRTYRVDKDDVIQYLRGEFWYEYLN